MSASNANPQFVTSWNGRDPAASCLPTVSPRQHGHVSPFPGQNACMATKHLNFTSQPTFASSPSILSADLTGSGSNLKPYESNQSNSSTSSIGVGSKNALNSVFFAASSAPLPTAASPPLFFGASFSPSFPPSSSSAFVSNPAAVPLASNNTGNPPASSSSSCVTCVASDPKALTLSPQLLAASSSLVVDPALEIMATKKRRAHSRRMRSATSPPTEPDPITTMPETMLYRVDDWLNSFPSLKLLALRPVIKRPSEIVVADGGSAAADRTVVRPEAAESVQDGSKSPKRPSPSPSIASASAAAAQEDADRDYDDDAPEPMPFITTQRVLAVLIFIMSVIQLAVGGSAYSWLVGSNNGSFYSGLVTLVLSFSMFHCTTRTGLLATSGVAGVGILVSAVGCVIDYLAAAAFASYNSCAVEVETNLLGCVCLGKMSSDSEDIVRRFVLRVTAERGSTPSCGALQTHYVSMLNTSGTLSVMLLLMCMLSYTVLVVALCRYALNVQTAVSLQSAGRKRQPSPVKSFQVKSGQESAAAAVSSVESNDSNQSW